MLIVRPTGNLAKRMKVKLTASDEKSSTLLGDWYANDVILERKQYILCASESCRLTIILRAAPYSSFHMRLPVTLRPVLKGLGIVGHQIESELREMQEVCLAKTANCSVLSSMNELKYQIEEG